MSEISAWEPEESALYVKAVQCGGKSFALFYDRFSGDYGAFDEHNNQIATAGTIADIEARLVADYEGGTR